MNAKPLTKTERAAAGALLAGATARPWVPSNGGNGVVSTSTSAEARRMYADEECRKFYGGELVGESMEARDVALIAAAPELLERYEATVRHLENQLAEATGVRPALSDRASAAAVEQEHGYHCGCSAAACGTRRALECAFRTAEQCAAIDCGWCRAARAAKAVG